MDLNQPSPSPNSKCMQHALSPSNQHWESSSSPAQFISCPKASNTKVSNYQWTDEENRKYYRFLMQINEKYKQTASSDKIAKINVQMSDFIKSRNSFQCRSHNQKMLKRFGSVDQIISYFCSYFQRKDGANSPNQAEQAIFQKQQTKNQQWSPSKTPNKPQLSWPLTFWDLQYSLTHNQSRSGHSIQNMI